MRCPKSVVQSLRHVQLSATPQTAAHQTPLYFTASWSLLKLMSIESVTPSNHLLLCPLLLFLPSIFPIFRVFSNESALYIREPKYWSFSISPSNDVQHWFPLGWTGWISLLSKGLSRVFSNTTVQKHQFFDVSAFFIVQLSHLYTNTGKTIALTRRTFVNKVTNISAF